MSLVNSFGSRAMSLNPAFIQNVQKMVTETGYACIKVNGHRYGVLMLNPWMDSVSSLLARGGLGAFIRKSSWTRGQSFRSGAGVKQKPKPNKCT